MTQLDVLIPHFNAPEDLLRSLLSVKQQTWPGEKRIVVVDDASNSTNKKAVEGICSHLDMNICLFFNPYNRGRPYTRNVLLDSITSPYVAWLDAGDEWYSDKLEIQFTFLQWIEIIYPDRPYWITCHYDMAWVSKNKRLTRQVAKGDQIKSLLMGSSLRAYLWTLLGTAKSFRQVGWFDEQLYRLQDLDFFIRFILHGGRIRTPNTTDKALCAYHKSDVGRCAQEIRRCNARIFEKYRVLYNRYGKRFKCMRQYDMEKLSLRVARANGDSRSVRRFNRQAFKQRPFAYIKEMLSGLRAKIGQFFNV